MNYLKTTLLLAAMTGIFCFIGYAAGGPGGMMIAFFVALAMNFFAYWNSDKLALATYGAKPLSEAEGGDIYAIVKELSARGDMPVPKVFIMQNPQPNAFATGRSPEHAAVAVTTGLLNILNRNEVTGVIAHELAHIKNRDTLIMTVTATIAGAIGMIANFLTFSSFFGGGRGDGEESGPNPIVLLAMSILAPLLATIVQLAVSRTREYSADKLGAELCGNPEWLASALEKIEAAARGKHIVNAAAEENPATAHMFIINPLLGQGADNLFSTHPDTRNRTKALRAMRSGSFEPVTARTPDVKRSGHNTPGFSGASAETKRPVSPWE